MKDSIRALNIDIIGAGPGGLYTAILARRHLPDAKVRVLERNVHGATFGFGVVFSDQALDFLADDDPEIYHLLMPHLESWKNMRLNLPAGQVTLDGVGFSAIGRLQLLEILVARAADLGVCVEHGREVSDPNELDADLIVGADGLNSLVRRQDEAAFGTTYEYFKNHFAWFGTDRAFDMLTQTFIETDCGPMNAHHYRYAADRSTFIIECGPDTWRAHGFNSMTEAQSAALCEALFENVLDGARLITNRSEWRVFPRLWCENWASGNRVLIGDAAHSSHFSIGSGTRLAMEDAIALVRALGAHQSCLLYTSPSPRD